MGRFARLGAVYGLARVLCAKRLSSARTAISRRSVADSTVILILRR